jgi:hypothetical protein
MRVKLLLIIAYCSSLVIDHLSRFKFGNQRVGIVYLYCDYSDQEIHNPANMMGSLVKQLVMALSKIPDKILQTFHQSKQRKIKLELADASEMLMLALQCFDQAYICVDALDECERDHRRSFLRSLGQLLQTQNSAWIRLRLFLTGRPHVESDVNGCLGIRLPDPVWIEAKKEDITRYISYKIGDGPDPKAMNENLNREIINTITDGSRGMYASLILCEIKIN